MLALTQESLLLQRASNVWTRAMQACGVMQLEMYLKKKEQPDEAGIG